MTPADYLKRPYGRVVTPDTSGFRAEVIEFPGCLAIGNTAAEALANLEEVAADWLAGTIEKGQPVPHPIDSGEGFSGKLVLRLPKSLHKRAATQAARDGVSLNQFIVACLAERMGEMASVNTPAAITYVPVQNLAVLNLGMSVGRLPQGITAVGWPTGFQIAPTPAGVGHQTGFGYVPAPAALTNFSETKDA